MSDSDILTRCRTNDNVGLCELLTTEQVDTQLLIAALILSLDKNHTTCIELVMGAIFANSPSKITVATVFNVCVRSDNIAAIRMVLAREQKINLHKYYITNLIPIFLAERIDIVSMLINYGLDINRIAYIEKIVPLRFLPKCNCLYYLYNENGEYHELCTPLSECAKLGKITMIKFLLEHGVRIASHHHLAIKKAACWGQIAALRLLCEHDASGVDPNVLLAICLEELHFKFDGPNEVKITTDGLYQVCAYLIDNGATVHNPHLLHQAIIHGRSAFIKLFMQYGADVNAGTECPIAAALFACCELDVVALLLLHINKQIGSLALIYSVYIDDATLLHSLLAHPHANMLYLREALLISCYLGVIDHTKILLEHVNLSDDLCLMIAVRESYCDMVKLLVRAGADLSILNSDKATQQIVTCSKQIQDIANGFFTDDYERYQFQSRVLRSYPSSKWFEDASYSKTIALLTEYQINDNIIKHIRRSEDTNDMEKVD